MEGVVAEVGTIYLLKAKNMYFWLIKSPNITLAARGTMTH